MSSPKISVIISIYNGEKDVHIMLDSLIAQKFEDIEYILIDNGSTDGTRAVCQSYADRDKRFRVEVIEKNIGYIRARNVGLTLAKGEYITFADADDYVSEDAYEIMYKAVSENDADMCIGPYRLVYSDGKIVDKPTNLENGVYNENEIKEKLLPAFFGYDKNNVRIDGFMWRMLFKRSITEKTGNIFYEEAKPKEDQIFNQIHALNSSRIVVIDYPIYNYIVNDNSVTAKLTSSFDYKDTWEKNKFLFDKSFENAKNGGVVDVVENSIFANIYDTIYMVVINTCKSREFSQLKTASFDYKEMFNIDYIKKMCDVMSLTKTHFLDKIILKSIKTEKYGKMLRQIKLLQKIRGGRK